MDQDNSPFIVEKAVARLLRAEREAQKLSRLGLLAHVQELDESLHYNQLSRMEDGVGHWTVDRFVFLAEALGLDPVDVLRDALRARGDPAEAEGGQKDARGPADTGPRAAPESGNNLRRGGEGTGL